MSAEGNPSPDVLPDPERRPRRLAGGPLRGSLRVRLRTVTPVLGGSSMPRELESWDAIRAPSIRGHLRFWWRALQAHAFTTSAKFADRERELWGGVGGDKAIRSCVELSVEVEPTSLSEDPEDVTPRSSGAYALWVASAQKKGGQVVKPAAKRWKPGVDFWLEVRAPETLLPEVKLALRAWILWGGYGSRTRRGLGSLTVVEGREEWLPRQASRAEWARLFPGLPLFGTSPAQLNDVPLLCGARLLFGAQSRDSERAWNEALGWLREFRQGPPPSKPGARVVPVRKSGDGMSEVARDPGDAERPGRSHWPEADKVRQLFAPPPRRSWAHGPRLQYSSPAAAWPRAGFGLPLAIRFQRFARKSAKRDEGHVYEEPENVELRWRDSQGSPRERLASPLIVKAMPLVDGSFVPIALWLRRAWPAGGQVILSGHHVLARGRETSAPFERVLPPGDTALYAPLSARDSSLEEIFLGWVQRVHRAKESQ